MTKAESALKHHLWNTTKSKPYWLLVSKRKSLPVFFITSCEAYSVVPFFFNWCSTWNCFKYFGRPLRNCRYSRMKPQSFSAAWRTSLSFASPVVRGRHLPQMRLLPRRIAEDEDGEELQEEGCRVGRRGSPGPCVLSAASANPWAEGDGQGHWQGYTYSFWIPSFVAGTPAKLGWTQAFYWAQWSEVLCFLANSGSPLPEKTLSYHSLTELGVPGCSGPLFER